MADLWTDYTDAIITGIDSSGKGDSKITLRDFLTDPGKYAGEPSIQNKIKNIREAADGYMDQRAMQVSKADQSLEDAIAKADTISAQIGQSVSVKAMQSKVPLIKPVAIDRDLAKEERIMVNSVDTSTNTLIDKLVSESTLVADFSTTYKNYRIGEWLFSGAKNYVLAVYLERNELLLIQGSKAEIDALIDAAANFIKGL
jgi:hypothetical protein